MSQVNVTKRSNRMSRNITTHKMFNEINNTKLWPMKALKMSLNLRATTIKSNTNLPKINNHTTISNKMTIPRTMKTMIKWKMTKSMIRMKISKSTK